MLFNIICNNCIDDTAGCWPWQPAQGTRSVELLERDIGLVVETTLFELRNDVLATTQAKCGDSFATGGGWSATAGSSGHLRCPSRTQAGPRRDAGAYAASTAPGTSSAVRWNLNMGMYGVTQ